MVRRPHPSVRWTVHPSTSGEISWYTVQIRPSCELFIRSPAPVEAWSCHNQIQYLVTVIVLIMFWNFEILNIKVLQVHVIWSFQSQSIPLIASVEWPQRRKFPTECWINCSCLVVHSKWIEHAYSRSSTSTIYFLLLEHTYSYAVYQDITYYIQQWLTTITCILKCENIFHFYQSQLELHERNFM